MPGLAENWTKQLLSKMHNMLIMPMSTLVHTKVPESGKDIGLFLASATGINAATSALQTVRNLTNSWVPAEALLAEILFIAGKFWYYKFLLNPTSVRFSHQKLQVEEETSDLTVINTYRNKSVPLSFTGVSGSTLPGGFFKNGSFPSSNKISDAIARYPKLSAAWMKFRQLERFYLETNTDVLVYYDMDMYIGKFVSFNYNQDANNPWVINYDIQLKIYPDLMLHTMTPSDYAPFWDAMYKRYGKSYVSNFAGKSMSI